MCPYCQAEKKFIKKRGFFTKKTTRAQRIQRFFCHKCRRSFSTQTGRLSYREKKPHENQVLYRLLCSGVSQSRIAVILNISRVTVARKIIKLARYARRDQRLWLEKFELTEELQFDEMETFEHSKCKPVSIAIAVNPENRAIIGVHANTMPAKGHLAKISRRKYGPRPDRRKRGVRIVMESMRTKFHEPLRIKSDKKAAYRPFVREYFKTSDHVVTKGRRGCVVGQGELKNTSNDPLFMLNHSCAMVRDNLKTMSRRTWCTVKKICRIQDLLDLYVHFHNAFVVFKMRSPRVCGDPLM